MSCGQAPTDSLPLPPAPKPKPPPPTPADGGMRPVDAGSRPAADLVPGIMEFFPTRVGGYFDRTLEAINRNDQATTVLLLSDPESYYAYPAEIEVPANSRRQITVRFVPTEVGVHEALLEIDACAQ